MNTLTKATIHDVLKSMANKAALVNDIKRDGQFADNIRLCPYYSELYGMSHTLKIMGIDFEFFYDEAVEYITGIQIMDEYIEVAKA